MKRIAVMVLLGFVVVIGTVRIASAAPQVLAALPVGEPYKLVCHNGVCGAEFSAICLQPKRPAPASHTPYRVLAKDMKFLKLTGLRADGTVATLPASALKVASLRSQTSVRFFLDEDVLEKRQLQSVSVGFDHMITLLPAPEEDDGLKQTVADIAEASAGVERVSESWVEINADNVSIARVTVRISNELPNSGSITKDMSDDLMERAISSETTSSETALDSARQLVGNCQRRSRFMPLRRCLEEYHDQIMLGLNGKYWSALKPGS